MNESAENNPAQGEMKESGGGVPRAESSGSGAASSTPNEQLEQQREGSSATAQLAALLSEADEVDQSVSTYKEEDRSYKGEGVAKVNWHVTAPAVIVSLIVVIWGIFGRESFSSFSSTALAFVVDNFGWAFVLFSTVFLVFGFGVALSKFGRIKLGRNDEAPEFSTVSWIAMMFAAGMGIGLMFYGVAEPLTDYLNGVPGHEPRNVSQAMSTTLLHWTLHPWAIYGIFGLAIAYSTFRLGRRQLLSSAFIPLIGERRAKGALGNFIDFVAIVATIFGTACSLGIGATQISAGLDASGLIDNPGTKTIILIVSVLTLAYLISAMSGVGKGIQYVSNMNMVLAALIAIFVFVVGPTVTILNFIPGSIGAYLSNFFEMIGRTAESSDGTAGEWLSSWTIFYWAWWISWSPFVGMFLARISRGRTIREFLFGVMLVPSGVSVVWFAIFGGTAIHLEQIGESIFGDGNAEYQLFDLLQHFPGGHVIAMIAVVLLATFFITSADSASTVMGSMSQSGQVDANRYVSAIWGLMVGLIGMTMLLTGGSDVLSNLQNLTIIAASPFLVVIIALMFAILKDLRNDEIYLDYREQQRFAARLARERRIHVDREKRAQARQRRSGMREMRKAAQAERKAHKK
ncbi:glycine betaine transporter BetP [Corynebacterium pelargi]|uniref:Glycine betaine transporter BetP n=2 Tax=Corynebacterium pelargi TaxID=1471400 RepID=A0A410W9Y6_9CORY|nr:BCCT family transporter [Corynebacterium pelargi]QAU52764.1 Glycine betaine transporter BetP [Corynebacterium pelargi]GGG78617.1 glycine betaine transporter BetP [Corynebacterium pelargi]